MLKKFLGGLVLGAAVSGTVSLLFAPKSGNQTRRELTAEIDEAANTTVRLDHSIKNFTTALTNLKTTANELLPAFTDSTKKQIETYKFQTEPRLKEINAQIEKIKAELPQVEK